jgi:hypothetical protein
MFVGDAGQRQRGGQFFLVELQIMPRARNGADIDEASDGVRSQRRDEIIERPGRMTDSQHRICGFHAPRSLEYLMRNNNPAQCRTVD